MLRGSAPRLVGVGWVLVSVALANVNKYLLHHHLLSASTLITLHLLTCTAFAVPLNNLTTLHDVKRLLAAALNRNALLISTAHYFSIYAGNAALRSLSIAVAKTVLALSPVTTALYKRYLALPAAGGSGRGGGERTRVLSLRSLLPLLLISAGTALAVTGEVRRVTDVGVLASLTALLLRSVKTVLQERYMSVEGGEVDSNHHAGDRHVQLLYVMSAQSTAISLLFCGLWWSDSASGQWSDSASGQWSDSASGQWSDSASGQWSDSASGQWSDWASGQFRVDSGQQQHVSTLWLATLTAVSCALAAAYNWGALYLTRATGAEYLRSLGNAATCANVLLSAAAFSLPGRGVSIIGILLTGAGLLLYRR